MKLVSADNFRKFCHEQLDNKKYTVDEILEMIDMQPTIYNVKNVVEQLEEHFNATDDRDVRLAYHHAIEIVKGGGLNG